MSHRWSGIALVVSALAACRTLEPPGPGSTTPSVANDRPGRSAAPPSVVAALSPEARSEANRARLPVLMFADPAIVATATVMSDEHWVAVSARDADRTLSIHATDVSHPSAANEPAPERDARVLGLPATLAENEGIRSIAWEEGDLAYSLDVECARPLEDEACTGVAYVRGLAETLVRIEGRGR